MSAFVAVATCCPYPVWDEAMRVQILLIIDVNPILLRFCLFKIAFHCKIL